MISVFIIVRVAADWASCNAASMAPPIMEKEAWVFSSSWDRMVLVYASEITIVTQPEGGHAPSADTACPVSWKTSFVPSGFDSLALRDGSYVPVTNPNLLTTRNDGSASTALLPHIGWRLGTTYVVRAYAFDGLYVDSEPFTIVNPVLFRVFFHMNGATGTAPGAQDVIYGETAVQPEDPLSAGRAFLGWHTEPEALNAYDFSTPSTTR